MMNTGSYLTWNSGQDQIFATNKERYFAFSIVVYLCDTCTECKEASSSFEVCVFGSYPRCKICCVNNKVANLKGECEYGAGANVFYGEGN